MSRKKFNLLLLNLLLHLLYSAAAANESSEEEYNADGFEYSSSKDKLAQINECQAKLFGNEVEIKREFHLDKETQMMIIDNYLNENLEFKQAYDRYKET
uniref:Uncharacterized protein n=1 Tax=Meloidogyne floridensis TaxID=298350 RepID=A0A915NH31_9BILA